MSVYMGEDGSLEILRSSSNQGFMRSKLDPDDVNVARRRFSFDFPVESLITGDRLEISTVNGTNLQLVAGWNYPDGLWYCSVDDAGGIRLYDTFLNAVAGGISNARVLIAPTKAQEIKVQVRNSRYRCIGQMRNWEITTSRTSVDVTSLGEEFIEQYNRGLISGQGRVTCIWDYKVSGCDPLQEEGAIEEPNYLCELILRLKMGSMFRGRFFIYQGSTSVWYEADCLITNTGIAFAPGQIVESQIEFITTGPIDLSTGSLRGYINQESDELLLQESDDGILLEDPS